MPKLLTDIKMRWTMNWRALISASLLLGSLGCSTDPDIVLIPNDRFLEPVYGQDGRMIRGRS